MNRLAMTTIRALPCKRFAIALAAALSVSACGGEDAAAPIGDPPLAGATIGGPFTLVSEDGEQVNWSDFDGKYRTVYFGYTYCPDVCPVDNQRAMAGLKQFDKAEPELSAKIQPLFVSVDPERDNAAVLTEFTDAFHPRLLGLSGTPEQLKTAADNFKVFYAKGDSSEAGGYLMDHSNVTYLFGPKGEPITTLPTDQGPDAVQAELAKWVR